MKKQTVKIGDEFFTIERPIERVDCLDYGYDLYQCYDRPSERKKVSLKIGKNGRMKMV